MQFTNRRDYYRTLISIASALLPESKKKDKLRKKEIEFLAICCDYAKSGNKLDNFSLLSKHIIMTGLCKSPSEVSWYKTTIGVKKWIKVGRDVFELNPFLMNEKLSTTFTCELVDA